MRWLDRVGRYAETLAELTRLQISGRTAAALRAAERALTSVSDPYVRAEIHIRRLSALVDLGRTAHYPAAVEEAFAAAGEVTDPYFHGHLHAITVLATRQLGSLERGPRTWSTRPAHSTPPKDSTSTSHGVGTTSRWPIRTWVSTVTRWRLSPGPRRWVPRRGCRPHTSPSPASGSGWP